MTVRTARPPSSGRWMHARRNVTGGAVALVLLLFAALATPVLAAAGPAKADPTLLHAAQARPGSTIQVIVRKSDTSSNAAERVVRALGGRVTHELPIIRSFSANVPAREVRRVASSAAVAAVSGDGAIHMSTVDMSLYDGYAPNTSWQAEMCLPQIKNGSDGTGVTVALLDTGVVDSPDLAGRVLAKVDFTPDHDGIDYYGHGTHMAGIIAGNGSLSGGLYAGVAPKANLVSVKVAGANGATDVSTVIAGLQWVYNHKAQYSIRVLNLSFGTDSQQSYLVDPLDYAVEQLWFSGIVVVVAAGNRGPNAGTINKPGDDPFVVTVGAANSANSPDPSDDAATSFSGRGPTQDGLAKPDLLSPE